jgi:hypothetical protein
MLFVIPVFFIACKKENATSPSANSIISDDITDADAAGVYKTTSGRTKLVLQPGSADGQDSWVESYEDDASYADHNFATAYQLRSSVWTINGGKIYSRSLIKFPGLAQISSSSQIVEAKLFLYGLDPNDPYLPQGNSYYPGSPYNDYGPNDVYVQGVTSAWDQNTVTWNNKPSSTPKEESVIPASTKQWNYNPSVDVTNLVKQMVKQPLNNNGFMLILHDETIYHSMGFYSSDAGKPQKRPKLVVVYRNSNPLAGAYLWDFKRWDWTDSTTVALSGLSFFGESTVFSPDDPTTIEVPSGYFIQPRYVLSFDNHGGGLAGLDNFRVKLNDDDVAFMADNGVTVTDGPNILIADPISQTFEFQYTVLITTQANRYIVDKYYKP